MEEARLAREGKKRGGKHVKALWRSLMMPDLMTRLVLLLRSWVELVTEAVTWP